MSDVVPEDDLTLARRGAERVVTTLEAHLATLGVRPASRAKLTDEERDAGRAALERARRTADEVLGRLRRVRPVAPPAHQP